MNLLDRQILAILAGEIQADLGISDSQMGFLYGTSFAVFYAIFGLPLGRLADLWVRKTLIACGLFTWSVMTMLCGLAGGAASLTFFRFGVGIGEATATPSAYSLCCLIGLSPKIGASVIAIYSTGAYIGMGLSMFIGGWIVDWWNLSYPDIANAPFGLKGWQVTFIIVGAPGILLAALFRTLKEPVRGYSENVSSIQNHPHPFREGLGELASILPPFSIISLYRRVGFSAPLITNILAAVIIVAMATLISHLTGRVTQWVVLGVGVYALFSWAKSLAVRDPVTYAMIFRCKSMIYVNLAYPIITFITYGFALWLAQYLLRKFDADLSELGMVLGLSTAICGGVGVATGGVVADLMKRHIREDAHTFHGPHIGHPHDHCGTFRAQRRNPARGLYCQRVSAVCQCSVDWCSRRHHYHPGPPQNARHGLRLLSGDGHFFRARYGAFHHRLPQRHVSSVRQHTR